MGKKFKIIARTDGLYIESGTEHVQGSQALFLNTGMEGTPTQFKIKPDGKMGNQTTLNDPLDIYHSATSQFKIKENGNLEITGNLYNKGIQTIRDSVELADDTTIALPSNSSGWGVIIVGHLFAFAYFKWDTSANITLIEHSHNIATDDTDTYFCIYNNGGVPTLKNRLGITSTVNFEANIAPVTGPVPFGFSSDSDTLALYHLDEASGTVLDSGPSTINGTNSGMTPNQSGPVWLPGTSYLSNSSSDTVTTPSTYWGSPISEGAQGTVEFFFKPTNINDLKLGIEQHFCHIEYVANSFIEWSLTNTTHLNFIVGGTTCAFLDFEGYISTYFSTSRWTYIKGIWDINDFGIRMYLNGTLVASESKSNNPFTDVNRRIFIGNNEIGSTGIKGYYDEFRYSKVVR